MVMDSADHLERRAKRAIGEERKRLLKEAAEIRAREKKRRELAEHNRRIAEAAEIASKRRVRAVRRTKPHEVTTDSRVAWWSRPSARALMARMQKTTAQHYYPSSCPHCGGTRVRYQTTMASGVDVYVCPVDYSQNILGTGCGSRFAWMADDPGESVILTEGQHRPTSTGWEVD